MPLKTKGITKKAFQSSGEAIEWARKQHAGESAEELSRFRLIAQNVPREFWTDTAKYTTVEVRFDADGSLDHFEAIDKAVTW